MNFQRFKEYKSDLFLQRDIILKNLKTTTVRETGRDTNPGSPASGGLAVPLAFVRTAVWRCAAKWNNITFKTSFRHGRAQKARHGAHSLCATGCNQKCILCPTQTSNHSVRQRKSDGRRKGALPAATDCTGRSFATCRNRFFFLYILLLG